MRKCKLTACSVLGDLVICEGSGVSCEYLNFQPKFTLLWNTWTLNYYLLWGKATYADKLIFLNDLCPLLSCPPAMGDMSA